MFVLLILNVSGGNMQVVVNLRQKKAILKVMALLQENREREAFDILKNRGKVEGCFSPGVVPNLKFQMTLVEDMCLG